MKKIIIGRIRSRKNMFIWLFIMVGIFIIPLYQFWLALDHLDVSQISFYVVAPNAASILKGVVLVGIGLTIIGTVLFLGSNQYIQIDKNVLAYCEAKGLIAKVMQFINSCIHKDPIFDIQVNMNQIEKIQLLYTDVHMWMYFKGHSIIFDIELKDGSIVRLMPDNLYLKKENCLAGIHYMESLGIIIDDPYHLKDALRDKDMRFAEYIDKREKHES